MEQVSFRKEEDGLKWDFSPLDLVVPFNFCKPRQTQTKESGSVACPESEEKKEKHVTGHGCVEDLHKSIHQNWFSYSHCRSE